MTHTVVIADDHPIVLRGLKSLIDEHPDFAVAATATNGRDASDVIQTHAPSLAVLDLRMPQMTGLEVLADLRAAGLSTRVVLLAATASDFDIYQAIADGVAGLVLKEAAPDTLIDCLKVVSSGQTWFPHDIVDPAVAREATRRHQWEQLSRALTPREREIVDLIADGRSNKDLAFALGLSEGTVKVHINNIFRKLGASTRADVVRMALANPKARAIAN